MLLDLRAEKAAQNQLAGVRRELPLRFALAVQIFLRGRGFSLRPPALSATGKSTIDDVHNVGSLLFENYNLPFQIIGPRLVRPSAWSC